MALVAVELFPESQNLLEEKVRQVWQLNTFSEPENKSLVKPQVGKEFIYPLSFLQSTLTHISVSSSWSPCTDACLQEK